ncbi:PepSY domain-containing protein [Neomoorella thermoacetica]|uniref:Propeptide, PepSY amd peptidase M4 n=1 Tax=Moorella thermoacetica (strain ATCC 39073 / JCM 9320) TaxID=264732 RepID=Q2RIF3_MOOTA|nr:PepSY domain-containing protein [Moorella thermoacetica]AKX94260.1 peptidase propeptide and YPEB domain protein [Moorella thermoacetica]AKX96898.1 peptidase propeptide and YPEB domain protein [Moorella thermoacetica]OIQ54373.1 peptidase propeptide and YPEB domain protein [Moorella thermoacetica]OIQ58068.1 peptidase propeptide and YPEB domain protein [Moorella thermoacetica]QDA00727.1 Peptidase propeptide and YPEB domain protein [Moorella thermoacetica]
MNKKLLASLTTGVMLLGAATGIGVFANQPAKAAAASIPAIAQSAATVNPAPANGQQVQASQQQPAYNASIKVANSQNDNGTEVNETTEKQNEAAESQALQARAKITADAAKSAALKAVPGTVKKVALDNENGNLVYSVEIQAASGSIDVKVDAGNGQVLAQDQDSGQDNEKGAKGIDNDNIQVEQ